MNVVNAKVFDVFDGFIEKDVAIEGDIFVQKASDEDILDGEGSYLIPGLIDIHTHGCVNQDYSTADLDGIHQMMIYQARHGVTAICPTTMTLPESVLAVACKNLSMYKQSDSASVIGIYLEGPFVSCDKLGAQNPNYLTAPDVEVFRRLQSVSGGIVKLLAIAPEIDGAMEMIDKIGNDVVCSIAHTTADYDTTLEGFRRGAKQVTHLYNAMPPFSHRSPGTIGAAFDTKSVIAELICDGVHVHPSAVRAAFSMFGDERIVLISDSMMATGFSDGLYELGGLPVEVTGNIARLKKNGAVAGSVTNLMDCMRIAVHNMGIPLHSAVKCASVNPAKVVGEFHRRGSIEYGKFADFVLLDNQLEIKAVFIKGKRVI